jgi:hypothetical protein
MKVYIVYDNSFETDKPRSYMASPNIVLATIDIDKARDEVRELSKLYNHMENIQSVGDFVIGYHDGYDFGEFGIREIDII